MISSLQTEVYPHVTLRFRGNEYMIYVIRLHMYLDSTVASFFLVQISSEDLKVVPGLVLHRYKGENKYVSCVTR